MKVAILFAVEQPADARLPAVPYAEADVLALAAVLEQHGFAAEDRLLLTGGGATKSTMESRVRRWLKSLTASDEVLVCYTGHVFSNAEGNYLTCHDTDCDDLAETSVRLSWLCQQIASSPCGKIALLVDPHTSEKPIATAAEFAPQQVAGELEQAFDSRETCACMVSCNSGESSYASGSLKHGLWAYHIVQALAGQAPAALVQGLHVTASSLQKYLLREVPRALAQTFASKKIQTPCLHRAGKAEYHLASMEDLAAEQVDEASPALGQVKNIMLLARRSVSVRNLAGFTKGNNEPDRVSSSAAAFVTSISCADITDDIQHMFGKLRSAFRFKRADLHTTDTGDGAATIITPHFNYSILVEQDTDDPTRVVFSRTVDAIKSPEQILSAEFAEVFSEVFDTIEFTAASSLDLTALVDRIEDLEDDRITVEYDPEVTYCKLHVEGVAGAITATNRSLSIVHAHPQPPRSLLTSLLHIQELLVDGQNEGLIAWDGSG